MADNNIYTMARHTLEDIQKSNGEITVADAMDVLYQSIGIVMRQMDNAFRNQAAIAAMQGMIAHGWTVSESETVAQNAFDFADAIIRERPGLCTRRRVCGEEQRKGNQGIK